MTMPGAAKGKDRNHHSQSGSYYIDKEKRRMAMKGYEAELRDARFTKISEGLIAEDKGYGESQSTVMLLYSIWNHPTLGQILVHETRTGGVGIYKACKKEEIVLPERPKELQEKELT